MSFNHEGIYTCECGKTFTNSQKFNAHKSMCGTHMKSIGKYEEWEERVKKKREKLSKALEEKQELTKKEIQRKLKEWIEEAHQCETCGKTMTEKFGSGKFCSRKCANTHTYSPEEKKTLAEKIKKPGDYFCEYCNKYFNNEAAKRSHATICENNPNPTKIKYDKIIKMAQTQHERKLQRKCKIDKEELDVTYGFIDNYLEEHLTCEICGRTLKESIRETSKVKPKRLCLDHDHVNSKFRGVLCSVCNRQLGWYERNKENIDKYLNKPYPGDV